jgi:hypothetical protein
MVKFKATGSVVSNISKAEQLKHGKKRERASHSIFHIVVNTNLRFQADDPDLIQKADQLKQCADDLLGNADSVMKGLKVNFRYDPTGAIDDEHILKIKTACSVERGNKFGQLHAHIVIQVKHKTKILVDKSWVENAFKAGMGLESLYCHINARRGSSKISAEQVLIEYIMKNIDDM